MTAFNATVVPDFCVVHVVPFREVRIVPEFPTATNWVREFIVPDATEKSHAFVPDFCVVHIDWVKALVTATVKTTRTKFLKRCIVHSLSKSPNPIGVKVKSNKYHGPMTAMISPGPCTPRVNDNSMSAVRLGPVMNTR